MSRERERATARDALEKAIEFLRFSLALATGSLVFSAGLVTEGVSLSGLAKAGLVTSWIALALSVATGVLAYSRVPVMLAEMKYDLEDPYFKWPGMMHQMLLILGAVALGVSLSLALWLSP